MIPKLFDILQQWAGQGTSIRFITFTSEFHFKSQKFSREKL